ncbi:hypothetical protein F5Y16DRAFT_9650 [Xylariaceae sp. FL0255]|nr:hypothetical protein F5Y16DRAFT_9650 [Xylariaceae sp. FL0255]
MKNRLILSLLNVVAASQIAKATWLRVEDALRASDTESRHVLARPSHNARSNSIKNTTSIAKSWYEATLISIDNDVTSSDEDGSATAGIEVVCSTCYVTGIVTAELDYGGNFNLGQAIMNFTSDVTDDIRNVTDETITYVENVLKNATHDIENGDFDFADIDFPPFNVSLNVDLPEISEVNLRFQLDGLELYANLDTTLSAGASYTLNLYTSDSPIGLAVNSDTFIGVIASIDLLLYADGDINLSSGLHLQANDGLALDISLFGKNVSSITYNGGSFEFLPVTALNSSGLLTATLRLGLHAGTSLDLDQSIGEFPTLELDTGAEVLVYADLAQFTTNITAVEGGDDSGCELRVEQGYQLALGAAAGATLVIESETWGPDESTRIPIFYTTLANVCAESTATATMASTSADGTAPSPTSTIAARAASDMVTTTISEEVTFTGLACVVTGLLNCPVSQQSTTKVVSTKTTVLTVPSGSKATFPATTQTTIPSLRAFANNAKSIAATTGSPVSYVPPPTTTASTSAETPSTSSGISNIGNQIENDVETHKPLIIGLSVGLGVPLLAGVIAAT